MHVKCPARRVAGIAVENDYRAFWVLDRHSAHISTIVINGCAPKLNMIRGQRSIRRFLSTRKIKHIVLKIAAAKRQHEYNEYKSI
jgi:hypothetical protein